MDTTPLLPRAGPQQLSLLQFAFLAATTGLSNASSDMYLPLMATIHKDLNRASALMMVLSLALNWICSGSFGPVWASVSSLIGRRAAMVGGLLVFIVGTLLSATAATGPELVVGRTVQGIGEGAARAISEVLLSDVYRDAGDRNAALAALTSTYPFIIVTAPVAGGFIGAALGWRAVFYILFAWGILLFLLCYAILPETTKSTADVECIADDKLDDEKKREDVPVPEKPKLDSRAKGLSWFTDSTRRRALAGIAVNVFSNAVPGTMLTVYPYTLSNYYGMSVSESGLTLGSVGLACILGATLNDLVGRHFDVPVLIRVGRYAYTALAAAFALLVVVFADNGPAVLTSFWVTLGAMYAYQIAYFFVYPAVVAVALDGLDDDTRTFVVGINSGGMILSFGGSSILAGLIIQASNRQLGDPEQLFALFLAWIGLAVTCLWFCFDSTVRSSRDAP